jgi:hypothetical protein
MTPDLNFKIDWSDAPGVSTPELAATWARYEVWVGARCVTQVETSDGNYRKSVFGSLYPLAEWVADNWWALRANMRPSAIERSYWSWPGVRQRPWLAQHNLRGAGDGMAWPNLTIVPEGDITQLVWFRDGGDALGPVRFSASGSAWSGSAGVSEALAGFVDHVLDRLAESGLPDTRLAEEWGAIGRSEPAEVQLCLQLARLGLDPYAIDDQIADAVVRAAQDLPAELVDDFLDSADPAALVEAADWTLRAVEAARAAATQADSLRPLIDATAHLLPQMPAQQRPWVVGYGMASTIRSALEVDPATRFDLAPWVAVTGQEGVSTGIQGLAARREDRCGLAATHLQLASLPFRRAKALGRVLIRPDQSAFLLTATKGYDERIAGAFAAELLAPAAGIQEHLGEGGTPDDESFERIAREYGVSPFVIRHQYDNQLAAYNSDADWPA